MAHAMILEAHKITAPVYVYVDDGSFHVHHEFRPADPRYVGAISGNSTVETIIPLLVDAMRADLPAPRTRASRL
jgi:hypothetical protein